MLTSIRGRRNGRGQAGARWGRALPGLAAVDTVALIREDGAAVAILTLATTGAPPTIGRGAEARLAALRTVLLALDAPAQPVIEPVPADSDAYTRAHAASTAGEPHPRLARLARDLRAWAVGLRVDDERPALALTVALSQPAGPEASHSPSAPATVAEMVWLGDGTASTITRPTGSPAARAALADRCVRLDAALGPAGLIAARLTGPALFDRVGRLGRSGGAARTATALDAEVQVGDVG